jgi:small subunit ribosomal protein S20
VRTLIKNFLTAVDRYSSQPSSESLQDVNDRMAVAYSKIDKAVKQGVLHANNGARKKSRLARALKRVNPPSSEQPVAS